MIVPIFPASLHRTRSSYVEAGMRAGGEAPLSPIACASLFTIQEQPRAVGELDAEREGMLEYSVLFAWNGSW
jgi:hypothetical protein